MTTQILSALALFVDFNLASDLENLALNQPANASSGGADQAVDGNYDNNYRGLSCTHTDHTDPSPWWRVDLGVNSHIFKVHILSFNLNLRMQKYFFPFTERFHQQKVSVI